MSRHNNRSFFFNFFNDFLLNLYQLREGDPIINEFEILLNDDNQIFKIGLPAGISSKRSKQLNQCFSELSRNSHEFFSVDIDVDVNSNS